MDNWDEEGGALFKDETAETFRYVAEVAKKKNFREAIDQINSIVQYRLAHPVPGRPTSQQAKTRARTILCAHVDEEEINKNSRITEICDSPYKTIPAITHNAYLTWIEYELFSFGSLMRGVEVALCNIRRERLTGFTVFRSNPFQVFPPNNFTQTSEAFLIELKWNP